MRVAVVGGSIAGCAAAIALGRAGHEVTVYERSASDLEERGFGIAIPLPLRDQLVSSGYLDAAMPARPLATRIWVARDPGRRETPEGRELWRQPSAVLACNWGLLWAALRARVPAACYVSGQAVTAVRPEGGGAIVAVGGEEQRVDLVVGADGYRSTIRPLVDPEARPQPAGYALWRASFPASRAAAEHERVLDRLRDAYVTVGFPGGHAVIYLIPARQPPQGPGGSLVNIGVYVRPPAPAGSDPVVSSPPGAVPAPLLAHVRRLADEHFPPAWAELLALADDASYGVHPVEDLPVARYRAGPVILAGDAGTVTRPHTASGATKALQDALRLERALGEAPDREAALAAYDAERVAEGNRLVELGRRIGHDQVDATPNWTTMGPPEMEAWTATTIAGQAHYLYGTDPPAAEPEPDPDRGSEVGPSPDSP